MIEVMDEPEELLYLVDASDQPIGTLQRQEVLSLEANGQGFTRAVGVFVINSDGKLWIPMRGEHKKIAPGGLDFSAGEHVGSGESYEAAALRGLQEELRIDPEVAKLTEVGTVPPFAGMPYFHRIYLYQSDQPPTYNEKDYSGYEWMAPEEAISRLTDGKAAKEILLPSIQLLIDSSVSGGEK